MCTAITYKTKDHYFGRNLDLEFSYEESVTITPRNYPFRFRKAGDMNSHYAIIGMAYVVNDYPLYYDATNEKGLSMAGLNFPGNADYKPPTPDKDNISPFELIPWILGKCSNIPEAKALLKNINLVDINFSQELPLSPLHWMISDREQSIVVESVRDGLHIYDNPVEVLTNNPPFEYHLMNLNNYMHLSKEEPVARFADNLDFNIYSRGMGAMGLPGDLSSASRFVRAAFVRNNSISGESEEESVSQFFHILGSVEQQRGCVRLPNRIAPSSSVPSSSVPSNSSSWNRSEPQEDFYEITIYSSCCNTDKGIYYYKTYDDWQIHKVNIHDADLDGKSVINYKI